jgi:hypothetical protein
VPIGLASFSRLVRISSAGPPQYVTSEHVHRAPVPVVATRDHNLNDCFIFISESINRKINMVKLFLLK